MESMARILHNNENLSILLNYVIMQPNSYNK